MDNLKVPNHIAFIMDGNGRWATAKGKNRSFGHLKGTDALDEVSLYAFEKGVKVVSVYAFSSENFNREEKEVAFLMDLFIKMFKKYKKKFNDKNIKVVFSGSKNNLKNEVLKAMEILEETTKNNDSGILNVCLNYGGQDEIVDTTKKIVNLVKENKIEIEDINKELFQENLYQNLPPIDFVVRTSGENRVSNFMLWQLSYAEFYFPLVHWPDFNKEEFDKAILEYNKRDRRFGKEESAK